MISFKPSSLNLDFFWELLDQYLGMYFIETINKKGI
jgi:hypothetical protein